MNKNKQKCIILIGPPACGKGTQAKILEGNIENAISISTGELIRKRGDLSGEYNMLIMKLLNSFFLMRFQSIQKRDYFYS